MAGSSKPWLNVSSTVSGFDVLDSKRAFDDPDATFDEIERMGAECGQFAQRYLEDLKSKCKSDSDFYALSEAQSRVMQETGAMSEAMVNLWRSIKDDSTERKRVAVQGFIVGWSAMSLLFRTMEHDFVVGKGSTTRAKNLKRGKTLELDRKTLLALMKKAHSKHPRLSKIELCGIVGRQCEPQVSDSAIEKKCQFFKIYVKDYQNKFASP